MPRQDVVNDVPQQSNTSLISGSGNCLGPKADSRSTVDDECCTIVGKRRHVNISFTVHQESIRL